MTTGIAPFPEFPIGWLRRTFFKHDVAFTIIELVVAIAIIAILAALLQPALTHAKSNAHGASGMNNHPQLAGAGSRPRLIFHSPRRTLAASITNDALNVRK